MIPDKAIMVYESAGEPYGDYVTTVFTPYDAKQIQAKLLKKHNVRRVIFTTITGKKLLTVNKNTGVQNK
jgi:hypothetical protein